MYYTDRKGRNDDMKETNAQEENNPDRRLEMQEEMRKKKDKYLHRSKLVVLNWRQTDSFHLPRHIW